MDSRGTKKSSSARNLGQVKNLRQCSRAVSVPFPQQEGKFVHPQIVTYYPSNWLLTVLKIEFQAQAVLELLLAEELEPLTLLRLIPHCAVLRMEGSM